MGNVLIWLALAAAVLSAWNYYLVFNFEFRFRGKKKERERIAQKKLALARRAFVAMTLLTALASAYLLYLIFTHQFQYEYVYRYSARNLSPGLLLSAFWAGQAGSFLLWAFYTAAMGLLLLKTARKAEAPAMLFLSVIQGFFLVLLTRVSPFIQHTHTPPDGAGLNPLLQNFWMVIHPPVLFLGYAAAAFPLVIALAALIRKDFDGWVTTALPWSLFSSITLGAGIIIGGYWAYGTLGWGGYWGWDPVENSSLVPWLVNFALFHGLIIQKVRGSLRRTNLLLAIVSFVLVLYATFLTRSGVLADFSVHSFQDLGINTLLIVFLLGPLVFGVTLLTRQSRQIPVQPLALNTFSRENTLLVSMLVVLASALLTLLGTSLPLLSRLFTQPATVSASFYNQVNLPLAIAMSFLLGITPLLKWGKQSGYATTQFLLSLMLAGLSVAGAWFAGLRDSLLVIFVATSTFAFWTNVLLFVQHLRVSWHKTGAPLAHVGVALMFVGIIISGHFDKEQYVEMTRGVPVEVLGHQLMFEGTERPHNGKDILTIRVRGGSSEYLATPRLYFTDYNKSMMKEPYIDNGWLEDFYLSPVERLHAPYVVGPRTLDLRKGEKKQFEGYEIRFAGFDMHDHGENGAIKIGANLEVATGGHRFSVTPALMFKGKQRQAVPVPLPSPANTRSDREPSIALKSINANTSTIQLAFSGLGDITGDKTQPEEQIALQVSIKPFMSVLWLGTILLMLGTVIALRRNLTMP